MLHRYESDVTLGPRLATGVRRAVYGTAAVSWGPERVVAVPLGDGLATPLFEGSEIPRNLPPVLNLVLGPSWPACPVDTTLLSLPDGFDNRARRPASPSSTVGTMRGASPGETPSGRPSEPRPTGVPSVRPRLKLAATDTGGLLNTEGLYSRSSSPNCFYRLAV